MVDLTAGQLKDIMPTAKSEDIDFSLAARNLEMNKNHINTPLPQVQFIAQIAHESGSFRYIPVINEGA